MKKLLFLLAMCACTPYEEQILDDIIQGADSTVQKVIQDQSRQSNQTGIPEKRPMFDLRIKDF